MAMLRLVLLAALVCGLARPSISQDAPRFEDRLADRVKEFTLDNGLKLLVLERRDVPVFSACTMVHVGSVDEHVGVTGVAHVFEHMAFKGSTILGTKDFKREQRVLLQVDAAFDALVRERTKGPRANKDKIAQLSRQFKTFQAQAQKFVVNNEYSVVVERNGGTGLNASTGSDSTQYFVSFPSNKLELWCMLEADRFTAPVLREFYKEKQVVVEERRMRTESNPIGKLIEEFLAVAFKAHPYGYPTIGHRSDIDTLRRNEAAAFFRRYYVPNNMVVAVVGDVDADACYELVNRYFSVLRKGPPRSEVETVEPVQEGERRVQVEAHAQPIVAVGFHRPSVKHPDDPIWDVMMGVLATGRKSRLYERLVKKEQVALQAGAFAGFPGNQYPNLCILYALPGVGFDAAELEAKLIEETEKLVREPVSAKELARVKTMLRSSFIRGLNSNNGLAMALATAHTVAGDWHEAFLGLQRIEAVTAEQIQDVAARAFKRSNRIVGSIVKPETAKGK